MTLTTQVIGQTEKALNAILDRLLAGTDITEPQWVTLTLTVVSGGLPAEALTARVSAALKVDSAIARERLAELTSAGLVRQNPEGVVEATERGKAQWEAVRAQVTEITQRLWGDLPEEDLAVAGRVLSTVLTRANAALATV
ncbi:MAG: winged helix DNA-binding protein [Hamadaea sp.]|nr:winged helix DNA-binding protein [Hamadaea sp.]NUT03944.1 winged helix DNA-binding protein [Hamadaea sp.]